MDLGFSPNDAAQTASQLTNAVGPFFWIMVILAGGMFAGMIYVAWGDKFQMSNLLNGTSGGGMIGLALVLMVGAVFLTDRDVRAWVVIRQNVVDPFIVSVLQKDSCTPETNRFCVVVWDPSGREIIVNWHDKRVNAFEIYNDLELTLYTSARPKTRPLRQGG